MSPGTEYPNEYPRLNAACDGDEQAQYELSKLRQRIAELEKQNRTLMDRLSPSIETVDDAPVGYGEDEIDRLNQRIAELEQQCDKWSELDNKAAGRIAELEAENEELRSAIRHFTSCTIEACNGTDDDDGQACIGHAAYEDAAKRIAELEAECESLRDLLYRTVDRVMQLRPVVVAMMELENEARQLHDAAREGE